MTPNGLAGAALVGFGTFSAAVLSLHAAQPELRPTTEAISYYVHGASGWRLTAGLLALGSGSLALAALLARTLRGTEARFVRWGVGLWGACVILAGILPADPRGRWSEPPSLPGLIHGWAALLGFVALPVAALALARVSRAEPAWSGATQYLSPLAVGTASSLVAFLLSLWPALGSDKPPILLGLTERILIVAYLAWLSATALRARRAAARGAA